MDDNSDQSQSKQSHFLGDLQSLSTRIATVQEISTRINRSLNLDEILSVVGQQAKWILDFDHCSVCLCDRSQQDPSQPYRFITLFGSTLEPLEPLATETFNPIERAIQSKQPQLIRDSLLGWTNASYHSQMIIPLESEDQVLGTINFAQRRQNAYSQEDIRIAYLLTLQVSAAIRNAQRFEEINQLYAELQDTNMQLRQAQGLRDELTHMIVHDLRNPLSSINVSLEMVSLMVSDPDKQRRWLDLAHDASQTMIGMIEDLLNLNKLEAGKLQLVLCPTNFYALVYEQQATYLAQARSQNKTLTLQIPTNLPPMFMDAGLINRVLDNLVSNAFKYTHSGSHIEISAHLNERFLEVYVQDDGLGIPSEYRDRIFDKFVQVADAKGASLRKGIGLGLAFCRMAIEAHGGKIWVKSTSGQGSTFAFTLPY